MEQALAALKHVPAIALYFGLVTQVLPFIIATVNRTNWKPFPKWCVATVSCFAASAGWFVIDAVVGDDAHHMTGSEWLTFALWICAGTALFYKLYLPAAKDVEVRTG